MNHIQPPCFSVKVTLKPKRPFLCHAFAKQMANTDKPFYVLNTVQERECERDIIAVRKSDRKSKCQCVLHSSNREKKRKLLSLSPSKLSVSVDLNQVCTYVDVVVDFSDDVTGNASFNANSGRIVFLGFTFLSIS